MLPPTVCDSGSVPGCCSCDQNAAVEPPPWKRVWDDRSRWRLALAFDSALPGWMCLVPRRHVLGLHELDDEEAVTMGRVLRAASVALVEVTGCAKTYVMLFAEQEGFSHLHLHIVPRARDLEPARRGPAVFGYLGHPGAADDALAVRLGAAIESELNRA